MRQFQISLLLLLLYGTFGWTQERFYPAFQINGNFQMGIPMYDFRNNLKDPGLGGGVVFAAHIGNSPMALGADLSIMVYASERARYNLRVGGFLKEYELQTNSNIFLGHALLRLQPHMNFAVKPYFDGLVGFKNLFTSTTLTDLSISSATDSGTDQSDWALSYGGAFGVQVSFSQNSSIVLDLRCAYLPGQNATYLVRRQDASGGFNFDDPIEAFEEKTSTTTLLIPQIGVTFRGLFNRPTQRVITPNYDDY